MKLEFTGLNTNKFHDELIAEGINPIVTSAEDKTWIDLPEDTSQETINKVNEMAALHDPLPRPQEPTETEQLKNRLQTAERAAAETSETMQSLLELLTDLEVI